MIQRGGTRQNLCDPLSQAVTLVSGEPPQFQDHRKHADEIIRAVLNAADPARALMKHWPAQLADGRPTLVIAIGKASLEMANVAVQRLGHSLIRAIVAAVPERVRKHRMGGRIEVLPVDHPWPSDRNVTAARAIAELASGAPREHRVVLLISGGGSAHLTLPGDGLKLEDLRAVSQALQRAGAPIQDLNAVRKHTEQLKGGRLAAMLRGSDIHAFILSDVMGDRLDAIASGPVSPDPTTYADALGVLDRYGAAAAAPRVTEHLRRGAAGQIEETPKPGDAIFDRVTSTVIAGNAMAVDAAAARAERLGFRVMDRVTGVEGEAASVGDDLARDLREHARESSIAMAVVRGGEPTVRADGMEGDAAKALKSSRGSGGPSQELALAAAQALEGQERMVLLAFSTDGIDGPTDAAGAVVTGQTVPACRAAGLDPAEFMSRHDSHTILDRVGAIIRTGPTGTNVNHVAIGLIYPAL